MEDFQFEEDAEISSPYVPPQEYAETGAPSERDDGNQPLGGTSMTSPPASRPTISPSAAAAPLFTAARRARREQNSAKGGIIDKLMRQPVQQLRPRSYSAYSGRSMDTMQTAGSSLVDAAGRAPPPTIMDLGLCDLVYVRASFVHHTEFTARAEILDRFKRLVTRCIKEEEEEELREASREAALRQQEGSSLALDPSSASEDGSEEEGPKKGTPLTVHFAGRIDTQKQGGQTLLQSAAPYLNGPETVPTGIPLRFLQRARQLLTWEYEEHVARHIAKLQQYRFSKWFRAQSEATRSTLASHISRLNDNENDDNQDATSSRGPSTDSSESTIETAFCGGRVGAAGSDDEPAYKKLHTVPTYLRPNMPAIVPRREEIGVGSVTSPDAPPEYICAWDIDIHDDLGVVCDAVKSLESNLRRSSVSWNKESDVMEDNNSITPELSSMPSPANVTATGASVEEDILIALPIFNYVMSRLLFRLHYAPLFPTGLFDRVLADPYFFSEAAHTDPKNFLKKFPTLYAQSTRLNTTRRHKQQERVTLGLFSASGEDSIDPQDYLSVFQLLAPPRVINKAGSSNYETAPFMTWLMMWPSDEDALLSHQSVTERAQRRQYRDYLQSVGQTSSIVEEVKVMMSKCRAVANELFELIDTEQRGHIRWSDFTDALMEHGEVLHHRMKAETTSRLMQKSCSVFDRYIVEPMPKQLQSMGYMGRAVEVRHSGSLVLLEGSCDYALADSAQMGSIALKLLVRPYERAVTDLVPYCPPRRKLRNGKSDQGSGDGAIQAGFDAALERHPWRHNQRIPSVFIRYKDGKRLHEQTALKVIEHLKKRNDEVDDDSDDKSDDEDPSAKFFEKNDCRETLLDAIMVTDVIPGPLPVLITHHSDLMLRIYSTANFVQAVPETAMLRTHETVTSMEWGGAGRYGCLSSASLSNYLIVGTREGQLIVLNLLHLLQAVPRFRSLSFGDLPSSLNIDASYRELALLTHLDNTQRYVVCSATVHKSVVSSLAIRDSGICISSSLDGHVTISRIQNVPSADAAKKQVQLSVLKTFHVCDSGVRRVVHAPRARIFVVQTVANNIFIYGENNHVTRVELFDPTALHFFPIIGVKIVDSLDQLITVDSSGYVKVWSISRSLPLFSFYALTEEAQTVFGHLAKDENGGGGEQSYLHEVDTSSSAAADSQNQKAAGNKKGLMQVDRRTIESNVATATLYPLTSFAYDYVTNRFVATGLHNAVMGSFASGRGEERAHSDKVRFLGIARNQRNLLTVGCSDARLWTLNNGNMTLGIRVNNPVFNLLAAERLNQLQMSARTALQEQQDSAMGDAGNIADAMDDHVSLDANKRPPQTIGDVIDDVMRQVPGGRPATHAGGRSSLYGTKGNSRRPATSGSTGTNGNNSSIERAAAGAEAVVSNRNDNTRNNNVRHGDVQCACWGPQERSIFYALSTGDIRMHRSDSGRLVKTYITTSVSADDILSAALQYRHLYCAARNSGGGGADDFLMSADVLINRAIIRVGMMTSARGGAGGYETSVWESMSSPQKVEAVAVMLQRLLEPSTSDAGGLAWSSDESSMHMEAISLHCLEASQELLVVYSDGILRYFPLVGHSVTARKIVIPEFLIAKCIYYLQTPSPSRRGPRGLPHGDTDILRMLAPNPTLTTAGSSQSISRVPSLRAISDRRRSSLGLGVGKGSISPQRRPSSALRKRSSAVPPQLPGIAEVDAVSIVTVSTYLQLVCVVHVHGSVTIMDMGSANGADVVHHTFTTPEEVTAATFLGAYPCIVLAERTGHLNFFLIRGAALLALFDDFYKAVLQDRPVAPSVSIGSQASGGGGGGSNKTHLQSQHDAASTLVWTEVIPTENKSPPSSIHFDPLNATLYVGMREGFVFSFVVKKLILALDLQPLGMSAAQVSLDTYVMALKHQQQISNKEAVRNILLVLFGVTPDAVLAQVREEETTTDFTQTVTSFQPEGKSRRSSSKMRWRNSLAWVYEHAKQILPMTRKSSIPKGGGGGPAASLLVQSKKNPWQRGSSTMLSGEDHGNATIRASSISGRSLSDMVNEEYILTLDTVTMSDLLLAAAIIHDSMRVIAAQNTYKPGAATASHSSRHADQGREVGDDHPAVSFLRMMSGAQDSKDGNKKNEGQDAAAGAASSKSQPASVVLLRSDITRIRQWIYTALSSTRGGSARYPRRFAPSEAVGSGGTSFSDTRVNKPFRSFVTSAREELLGATMALSSTMALHHHPDFNMPELLQMMPPASQLHPITSRWVEPIFERHSVFMSANSPLALLSPAATLERARRERFEIHKRMTSLQRTPQEDSASVSNTTAAAAAAADDVPQRPPTRWDEYVEGTVPRLVTEVFSHPGRVLREAARLRKMNYTVTQITTRRNGYVLIGNADGTISTWTPYLGARVDQLCANTTLPVDIAQLARSVKLQFKDAHDRHVAQKQRAALELGRDATEGEEKIKSHIKSMLLQHRVDEMKREEEREQQQRKMETSDTVADDDSTGSGADNSDSDVIHPLNSVTDAGDSRTTTVEGGKSPRRRRGKKGAMLSSAAAQASNANLQRLFDLRQTLQLSLGVSDQAFRSKHLLVEDLCFLHLRLSDLAQQEAFDPNAYGPAVDLAMGRLLQDLCGVDTAYKTMSSLQKITGTKGPGPATRELIDEPNQLSLLEVAKRGTVRLVCAALHRTVDYASDVDFINLAHELLVESVSDESALEMAEVAAAIRQLREEEKKLANTPSRSPTMMNFRNNKESKGFSPSTSSNRCTPSPKLQPPPASPQVELPSRGSLQLVSSPLVAEPLLSTSRPYVNPEEDNIPLASSHTINAKVGDEEEEEDPFAHSNMVSLLRRVSEGHPTLSAPADTHRLSGTHLWEEIDGDAPADDNTGTPTAERPSNIRESLRRDLRHSRTSRAASVAYDGALQKMAAECSLQRATQGNENMSHEEVVQAMAAHTMRMNTMSSTAKKEKPVVIEEEHRSASRNSGRSRAQSVTSLARSRSPSVRPDSAQSNYDDVGESPMDKQLDRQTAEAWLFTTTIALTQPLLVIAEDSDGSPISDLRRSTSEGGQLRVRTPAPRSTDIVQVIPIVGPVAEVPPVISEPSHSQNRSPSPPQSSAGPQQPSFFLTEAVTLKPISPRPKARPHESDIQHGECSSSSRGRMSPSHTPPPPAPGSVAKPPIGPPPLPHEDTDDDDIFAQTDASTSVPQRKWRSFKKKNPAVRAMLSRTGTHNNNNAESRSIRPAAGGDGGAFSMTATATAPASAERRLPVITRTKKDNYRQRKVVPPAPLPAAVRERLARDLKPAPSPTTVPVGGDPDGVMSLSSRKKNWGDILPN